MKKIKYLFKLFIIIDNIIFGNKKVTNTYIYKMKYVNLY